MLSPGDKKWQGRQIKLESSQSKGVLLAADRRLRKWVADLFSTTPQSRHSTAHREFHIAGGLPQKVAFRALGNL
jgi:hypothetical protein